MTDDGQFAPMGRCHVCDVDLRAVKRHGWITCDTCKRRYCSSHGVYTCPSCRREADEQNAARLEAARDEYLAVHEGPADWQDADE